MSWFAMPAALSFAERFERNFVEADRWMQLVDGLKITLWVSLLAVLLGIVLGVLLALMRLSRFKPLSFLAGMYIDIVRERPWWCS